MPSSKPTRHMQRSSSARLKRCAKTGICRSIASPIIHYQLVVGPQVPTPSCGCIAHNNALHQLVSSILLDTKYNSSPCRCRRVIGAALPANHRPHTGNVQPRCHLPPPLPMLIYQHAACVYARCIKYCAANYRLCSSSGKRCRNALRLMHPKLFSCARHSPSCSNPNNSAFKSNVDR